jgi:predicted transcriptional regulator
MDAGEVSDLLRTTVQRYDLLSVLGSEAVDKRDLPGRLDVSRSTVDRGVRELEEHGLVERADGGVRLTLAGRLVCREFDRTTERLGAITHARDLLDALPSDATVDPSVLAGADLVRPSPSSPYDPVSYQNDLVRGARRVKVCATAVVPPQVDIYQREVVEGSLELVLVATDPVLDRLVRDHGDALAESLATGRVEVYRTSEDLPYGVAVVETGEETEMYLTVYGDDGIAGTLGSDRDEAVAWARDRVAEFLDGAERVERP